MRCHGLKGFHPKWWCLSYWRSFQIGGTLLFDVIWLDESFSVLTTPWALSFTVVLQMISLPLKSKLLFQTCSNDVALYNLIAKFKTKLPTFHRVGPSEGMCICGTAVWLIVSLHNDEINWDKIAFKLLKWILLVAGCCRSASERPMNNLAPLESKQWCNYTSRSSRRLWVSNPV